MLNEKSQETEFISSSSFLVLLDGDPFFVGTEPGCGGYDRMYDAL